MTTSLPRRSRKTVTCKDCGKTLIIIFASADGICGPCWTVKTYLDDLEDFQTYKAGL
jgi:hypothetical protein